MREKSKNYNGYESLPFVRPFQDFVMVSIHGRIGLKKKNHVYPK